MSSDKTSKLIDDVVKWLRFQKDIGIEIVERTGPVNVFLGIKDNTGNMQYGGHDTSNIAYDSRLLNYRKKGLLEIKNLLGNCKRCELHKTRKNIVFGEGPDDARIFIVGEAPDREEELKGQPFTGASGELLTKMLKAIGIERDDVYITNVIKCRPPKNRTPKPNEISSCAPFLAMQIQAVYPEFILAMGQTAAQMLLNTKKPVYDLRGVFYPLSQDIAGTPEIGAPNPRVIITYHPAHILRLIGDRQKAVKLEVWKDLQMLQHEYKKD
ncbi:MAG: uracil-DNA glycosylase [Dissulfurimicrobium sp.]|uniref:uracil-DNA glycosylase n=1 Tax=Dissulfurimicrobium sp. TaxID=2022436 RepID=UPI00404956CA